MLHSSWPSMGIADGVPERRPNWPARSCEAGLRAAFLTQREAFSIRQPESRLQANSGSKVRPAALRPRSRALALREYHYHSQAAQPVRLDGQPW